MIRVIPTRDSAVPCCAVWNLPIRLSVTMTVCCSMSFPRPCTSRLFLAALSVCLRSVSAADSRVGIIDFGRRQRSHQRKDSRRLHAHTAGRRRRWFHHKAGRDESSGPRNSGRATGSYLLQIRAEGFVPQEQPVTVPTELLRRASSICVHALRSYRSAMRRRLLCRARSMAEAVTVSYTARRKIIKSSRSI